MPRRKRWSVKSTKQNRKQNKKQSKPKSRRKKPKQKPKNNKAKKQQHTKKNNKANTPKNKLKISRKRKTAKTQTTQKKQSQNPTKTKRKSSPKQTTRVSITKTQSQNPTKNKQKSSPKQSQLQKPKSNRQNQTPKQKTPQQIRDECIRSSGTHKGRLKKGCKYTGKKTSNGKPEIKQVPITNKPKYIPPWKRKWKTELTGKAFQFGKYYRDRGLRPGDTPRTDKEVHQLYNSVPTEIRNKPSLLRKWLRKTHFGHKTPHSQNGGNSVTNMVWQDATSNLQLGATEMPPCLKGLVKMQNKFFTKNGKYSARLSKMQKECIDKAKKGSAYEGYDNYMQWNDGYDYNNGFYNEYGGLEGYEMNNVNSHNGEFVFAGMGVVFVVLCLVFIVCCVLGCGVYWYKRNRMVGDKWRRELMSTVTYERV